MESSAGKQEGRSTRRNAMATAWLLCMALVLGGCGGGSNSVTPSVSPTTLSGVVASGGPLSGASVAAIDNTGHVVATTTSTSDGSYSLPLPAGTPGPLLIRATTVAAGLSSIWLPASGSAGTGTVNVTPLTNLLASLLSQDGDPASTGPGALDLSQISPTAIAAKTQLIQGWISKVETAIGGAAAGMSDLIATPFQADGTGIDQLLDSLHVSVVPTGTTADVQISLQEVLGDASQPSSLVFTSTNPPQGASLAAPGPGSLAPVGLAADMQTFLSQFNACMAQPLASRSSGNSLLGSTCTSLFLNGDPSSYLSNGKGIAKAWPMLFDDSQTGGHLSEAQLQFGRSMTLPGSSTTASTWIFSALWTSPSGSVSFYRDNFYLADSGGASTMVLLGNQYAFKASAYPIGQEREFVNNQAQAYWSSGYSVTVPNYTDSGGHPTIDHVLVTPPLGSPFTLVPNTGCSFLVQTGFGCTNLLRYAWSSLVPPPSGVSAADPTSPLTYESLLFMAPNPMSDAQVVAVPDQSSWRFDFYMASAPTTLAATEYYRTSSRMMTVGELQAMGDPQLISPTIANLEASSITTVNWPFSRYLSAGAPSVAMPPPSSGGIALAWSVPGQQSFEEASIYGFDNASSAGFNDVTNVGSLSTSGTVLCQAQTVSDLHCSAGNYASGTGIIGIELDSADFQGRNYSHFYALYRIY